MHKQLRDQRSTKLAGSENKGNPGEPGIGHPQDSTGYAHNSATGDRSSQGPTPGSVQRHETPPKRGSTSAPTRETAPDPAEPGIDRDRRHPRDGTTPRSKQGQAPNARTRARGAARQRESVRRTDARTGGLTGRNRDPKRRRKRRKPKRSAPSTRDGEGAGNTGERPTSRRPLRRMEDARNDAERMAVMSGNAITERGKGHRAKKESPSEEQGTERTQIILY